MSCWPLAEVEAIQLYINKNRKEGERLCTTTNIRKLQQKLKKIEQRKAAQRIEQIEKARKGKMLGFRG